MIGHHRSGSYHHKSHMFSLKNGLYARSSFGENAPQVRSLTDRPTAHWYRKSMSVLLVNMPSHAGVVMNTWADAIECNTHGRVLSDNDTAPSTPHHTTTPSLHYHYTRPDLTRPHHTTPHHITPQYTTPHTAPLRMLLHQ